MILHLIDQRRKIQLTNLNGIKCCCRRRYDRGIHHRPRSTDDWTFVSWPFCSFKKKERKADQRWKLALDILIQAIVFCLFLSFLSPFYTFPYHRPPQDDRVAKKIKKRGLTFYDSARIKGRLTLLGFSQSPVMWWYGDVIIWCYSIRSMRFG